ncbi:MAG: glycoside hydrolase family 4 [Paenibacillaceae bacterium]|nr:glycoside hydrolase family 4 [Paenibacillaceae bacterium]
MALAKMVAEANNVKLRIEGSVNRKEVLKGADFVILSFARETVKYRGIDCTVSEKYGIRMCSGDTIGPGGIFRAMRDFPVILECARDIEALCPEAWVISYINPTAVHGMGLKRYAPRLKSFALCDSQHMPHIKQRYAASAGIVARPEDFTGEHSRKFDFRIAGVNHFTWLIKAEYEGKDMSAEIARSLEADAQAEKETLGGDTGAKAIYNNAISYESYSIFGRVPTCTGHTKEYVRFWQGHGKTREEIPAQLCQAETGHADRSSGQFHRRCRQHHPGAARTGEGRTAQMVVRSVVNLSGNRVFIPTDIRKRKAADLMVCGLLVEGVSFGKSGFIRRCVSPHWHNR